MSRWATAMVVGVIGAVAAAAGCAASDDVEQTPLVQIFPDLEFAGPAGVEAFVIESDAPHARMRTPLGDSQMWPHEIGAIDPCECSTAACIDSWVNHNLGCNVCVVLYCGDHPAQHACSDCSGAAAPR